MPRLEESPSDVSFSQLVRTLSDFVRPFLPMWPFYWLKGVAVLDQGQWYFRHLALIGKFSDVATHSPFEDRGQSLIAVSELISAEAAQKLLFALQNDSLVDFHGLSVRVPTGQVSRYINPQTGTASSFPDVRSVAETATWRYLSATTEIRHPEDSEGARRIEAACQRDLELMGCTDFRSFMRSRVGHDYDIDRFRCHLDFPLALRVEMEAPDRTVNGLAFALLWRKPLTPQILQIRASLEGLLATAKLVELGVECIAEDGWSVGHFVVPRACKTIWFLTADAEIIPLPYELQLPTVEDETLPLIGAMFRPDQPQQGLAKWNSYLESEQAGRLEAAVANALARLGVSVLFGGQRGETGEPSGPETPAYDLVALDHSQRRAALLSVKGSDRTPSEKGYQALVERVEAVQQLMPGWSVTGILVCNLPDSKLSKFRDRSDASVWGVKELRRIKDAHNLQSIYRLLWPSSGPTGTGGLWGGGYA